MEAVVDTTPQRATSNASRWPKRSRARPLTLLDRRSVAARRIAELKQLFTTALADAGVNVGTPMRRLQIEQAASAMAVAESEAIVRAERRAGGSALRLRGHAVNSRRWRPTWRRGRRRRPCPLPSHPKTAEAVGSLLAPPASVLGSRSCWRDDRHWSVRIAKRLRSGELQDLIGRLELLIG